MRNSRSHSAGDSAEVGSSMIRMRASSDSALAISTSCCSPTRSPATRASGSRSMPSRPRSSRAAATVARRSRSTPPISGSRPRKMLAATRQFRDEVQLLVDDRDPGRLGVADAGEAHRLAADPDLALVVGVHAGEDLHQRRLAGAVLAHQRVHLAGRGGRRTTALSAVTPAKRLVTAGASRSGAARHALADAAVRLARSCRPVPSRLRPLPLVRGVGN